MRVWMQMAERFYQLPLTLIGVAIGVALLPRLATALQREDHADAQAAMDQAVVFGLFSVVGSQVVSNVPFVILAGEWIPRLAEPRLQARHLLGLGEHDGGPRLRELATAYRPVAGDGAARAAASSPIAASKAPARASAAPARPRRGCGRWRNTRCAAAAASTTASGSTTPC